MSVIIKGYTLVNEDKAKRAYDRELGVGPTATEEQVLQQYAKFGGLILKGADVVANELFWDFANKKPVGGKEESVGFKVEEVKKEVKKVKKVK